MEVERLLAAQTGFDENSAVATAAEYGDVTFLKKLIEEKAALDTVDAGAVQRSH